MTLKELKNKVSIGCCTHGAFNVTITYRGREYTCVSNNTLAYDVIRAFLKWDDRKGASYTPTQAYQALYDEVKYFNNL